MQRTSTLPALFATMALFACASDGAIEPGPGDFVKGGGSKSDTSAEAIFVDFEFDAHLVTNFSFNHEKTIEDQLLYTIGQLNQDRSVGRLDKLILSNVQATSIGGRTEISYHAKLPVAWGRKNSVPQTHDLLLPVDMGSTALNAFAQAHGETCVDFGAHDVDSGSMWYYFRPERSSCNIDSDDLVVATASVSLSSINTTGKYPEYHKVWEDDVLKVVAIFGKYEDGTTSNSDAGIAAYNEFSRDLARAFDSLEGYATEPLAIPFSPGVAMPELQFSASLGGGKTLEVVALLVDNVRTAPPAFDSRYEELSGRADLIAYNGHAGLGANIRTLARKGQWLTGQYAIVFMNGCDTYAYVDNALGEAHSAVNSDDPMGTKYMDIVTNAMPSFFHSMSDATMAMIDGLIRYDDPVTYETIFLDIDRAEVVLVSGEEDNVFVPGMGGTPGDWDGIDESGSVGAGEEHHFQTPVLPAGHYEFFLDGTNDADLYVRIGSTPTEASYDCRPYLNGSREECFVDLPSPATINLMVRGWASQSDYSLSAR